VVIVPTVREPDGLALSSRNAYLTPGQRRVAPVVYRSLCQAKEQWRQGERDAESLRRTVRSALEREPLVERIDYISLADATTLAELDIVEGRAMVLVAVKLGNPRLIDNILLE
jgi:pantoate--beta-alanine ligase